MVWNSFCYTCVSMWNNIFLNVRRYKILYFTTNKKSSHIKGVRITKTKQNQTKPNKTKQNKTKKKKQPLYKSVKKS